MRRNAMNVLTILGSRNPAGRTAQAAGAMGKGLQGAGAAVEQVFLPALKLERCRQCDDSGWGICRTEGRCVIEDDFAALAAKLRAADAAVFANPVYFSDLSESLRAFLDRLRRVGRGPGGKNGIEGKPAVGVCMAGGGGGGAPACAASLEKVLATCGFAVLDVQPVRRQNLAAKLPVLELLGQALAGGTLNQQK